MLQVTLAEKIGILANIITSSPIFICITIFTILLNIALYKNINSNKNILKKVFITFYIVIFAGLLIQYYETILNILDYLIENILKLIYFPNLAAYIFMIIITNIIMISTMLNEKMKKTTKLINTTIYSFITLLFILIIFIVFSNQVNVYEMFSIYTNQNLLVLIELSSFTFIIWGICIILNYVVNFITNKIDYKTNNELILTNSFNVIAEKSISKPRKNILAQPLKHYDGPIIDNKQPAYSIFKRINDYLDMIINAITTKTSINKTINNNHENVYIEKTTEEKKPTKYIIVDEIKNNMANNYSEPIKKNTIAIEEMTLAQCYELRNILLSIKKAEKAK